MELNKKILARSITLLAVEILKTKVDIAKEDDYELMTQKLKQIIDNLLETVVF